jgi:hypothetical protein
MVQQKMDNDKASYYSSASGCLVTIVGFILFFHWPIGTIAGIAVMFIGKQMLFREPTKRSFRTRRKKN